MNKLLFQDQSGFLSIAVVTLLGFAAIAALSALSLQTQAAADNEIRMEQLTRVQNLLSECAVRAALKLGQEPQRSEAINFSASPECSACYKPNSTTQGTLYATVRFENIVLNAKTNIDLSLTDGQTMSKIENISPEMVTCP